MNVLMIIMMAIVGAAIGWLTNIIAIKLIFRPYLPFRVPIVNFELQGLIPKRRKDIAKSIGIVVEEELIDIRDIFNDLVTEEELSKIEASIKEKVLSLIEEKMPSIIPSMFKNSIRSYVADLIDKDGRKILDSMIEKTIEKAADRVSIAELVEEKINSFEISKLEDIIVSLAKKELKHIEILGGILGFVIGLFQGAIVLLIS